MGTMNRPLCVSLSILGLLSTACDTGKCVRPGARVPAAQLAGSPKDYNACTDVTTEVGLVGALESRAFTGDTLREGEVGFRVEPADGGTEFILSVQKDAAGPLYAAPAGTRLRVTGGTRLGPYETNNGFAALRFQILDEGKAAPKKRKPLHKQAEADSDE